MVVIYRWSLYTGGRYIRVIVIYRWSLYTSGRYIQVVAIYEWSLYTGGRIYTSDRYTQVVIIYVQVVTLNRWSLRINEFYSGRLFLYFA